MGNPADQNYYELLEISPEAPQHEIVRAYQRAKDAYSPESPALYTMFTEDEARQLRGLIDEAFEVLSNMTRRREYDARLQHSKELPDFPAVSNAEPKKSKPGTLKKEKSSEDPPSATVVPEGFKKHKFGVYELKQDIEDEIKANTHFSGEYIRKIRLYKNINLEQLSSDTRISRTYLNAIELEDYDALPAAVFVRGFLIQVGRILGLDENQVATDYMTRFKKS